MVKKTSKKSQKSAPLGSKGPKSSKSPGREPAWLEAVIHPFDHAPTGIPDELCTPSIKATSRIYREIQTYDVSGTVNHGIVLGILPHPMLGRQNGDYGASIICQRRWKSADGKFDGEVQNVQSSWPNSGAVFPSITNAVGSASQGPYRSRVTAMEAKLSYMGTELSRAGRITAGIAQMQHPITTSATIGNSFNAINMTYGYNYSNLPQQSPGDLMNRMRRLTTMRNPDGSVSVTWIPSGVPKYVESEIHSVNEEGTSSAWVLDLDQFIDSNPGPALFIMIDGDMTTSGSTVGNFWSLELVAHWEILPVSRIACAIQPTPSPYDVRALEVCLNAFERLSSVQLESTSGTFRLADGGQHTTGTAWESLRGLMGRAYENMNTGALQEPAVRQALGYGLRLAQWYTMRHGNVARRQELLMAP